MRSYESPILVIILRIFAAIYALACIGVILFAWSEDKNTAAITVIAGLIGVVLILGIAQVISFMGKTAYYSEATANSIASLLPRAEVARVPAPQAAVRKTAPSGDLSQDPDIVDYLKKKQERA